MITRHIAFLLFCGAGLAFFGDPMVQLLRMSSSSELYSHIPVIPLISLCILIFSRKRIFAEVSWQWRGGLGLVAPGLVALLSAKRMSGVNENDYLSVVMLGAVLSVMGSFVLVYGGRAFKEGLFPLLFLVFVIPVPKFILDPFVELLQTSSAHATHLLFNLTGIPFHRDGFIFALPGITIEVAEQCSGIRSSIALIITSVFAGYLFLKRGWSRLILVLSFFPITVLKNAMRIATLSLLASYVDTRFITGSWLHKSGGIPFFAVGLALMAPVLWGLIKWEQKGSKVKGQSEEARKPEGWEARTKK